MPKFPNGGQNIAKNANNSYTIHIIEANSGQSKDTVDLVAAIKRYDHLEESLENRLDAVLGTPEMESLGSPLLSRVGIMDLNKVLGAMGEDTASSLLEMASISHSTVPIYLFRNHMEHEMYWRESSPWQTVGIGYDDDRGRDLVDWMDLTHLQNSFYPIDGSGFVGQLANTKLWSRLLGVPQLSWDRNYPLNNEHSRGSHSLFATVNVARVLQALFDASPEKLVERLRRDFIAAKLVGGDEADDAILQLAPDLAVLLAMSHDIYTPLGGDMMKSIMGMDEEADIANLLKDRNSDYEADYRRVIFERGLDERHIQFVIDCAQGKSDSLIGQLIHSEEGDILEQDRLAYTVQDLFSAGVLGVALPKSFHDGNRIREEQLLEEYYWEARRQLSDGSLSSVGPIFVGGARPSLTVLDVADDYALDDNLELICMRPDKLAWLAAFRVMMSAEFYQGAKLRGQQRDFGELTHELVNEEGYDELFSRDNLLRSTNKEFQEAMIKLGNAKAARTMRDMSNPLYPHEYKSQLVADTSDYDESWLKVPIKIKPGLDTKVRHADTVMTLGEFVSGNDTAAARLLGGSLDYYSGKTRVIKRVA